MNNYRKEYFNDYCYFLLEGDGDNFYLNYSLYSVISESKNSQNKKRIKKENLKNIEKKIQSILNKNKKVTKSEIDELVDSDGTFLSSRIPILNKWLTPKKTMDQTIKATRTPGLTFIYGGGRRLYGENIEDDDNLKEINMKKTFGYEETEFKDLKDTLKTLDKMGIDDSENRMERAKDFGKKKSTKVVKNKKGETIVKNLNLFEKELQEAKKQKMIKMVEDMLTKKRGESDILKKDTPISKLLVKNLESIKKLAEKEGISIDKLLNILKKGE